MPGRLSVQVVVQDKDQTGPLVDCTMLLFNREATPLPVEVTAVRLNGKDVLPRPARWELKGLETRHLIIRNLAVPSYEADLNCELALSVDGQTVRLTPPKPVQSSGIDSAFSPKETPDPRHKRLQRSRLRDERQRSAPPAAPP